MSSICLGPMDLFSRRSFKFQSNDTSPLPVATLKRNKGLPHSVDLVPSLKKNFVYGQFRQKVSEYVSICINNVIFPASFAVATDLVLHLQYMCHTVDIRRTSTINRQYLKILRDPNLPMYLLEKNSCTPSLSKENSHQYIFY